MRDTSAYTIKHIHRSFIENVKGNRVYDVDYNTFRHVAADYLKWIMAEMFERSKEVKLPGKMGSVLIIKRRPFRINRRNFNVDFKTTNELGKTVLHLNEHSDGFRYRFKWKVRDVILKNKSLYEMVMSRDNKRMLAHIIKNKLNDFIEQ